MLSIIPLLNKMEGVSILALHFKAFGYVSGGKFSRIVEMISSLTYTLDKKNIVKKPVFKMQT